MKQIYSARDEMEAHFVRDLLEQEGIEAAVQGEALLAGAVPLMQEAMPTVWVKEEDVARAAPIVEEVRNRDKLDNAMEDQPVAASSSWKCPRCGEVVEGQFGACWKCGGMREGTAMA